MAKPKDTTKTTVTRLKASNDKKPSKKAAPSKSAKLVAPVDTTPKKRNFFIRFLGYFKGAWYELRQVRWPNRRATLGMTLALLLFTLIFAVLILVVDLAWENLFKLILR